MLGNARESASAEYDLVFNAGVLEHYTHDDQVAFLRGMASRSRRYVLLDRASDERVARRLIEDREDRIALVRGRLGRPRRWPDLVLARPDGYVAWAGPAARAAGLADYLGHMTPPATVTRRDRRG